VRKVHAVVDFVNRLLGLVRYGTDVGNGVVLLLDGFGVGRIDEFLGFLEADAPSGCSDPLRRGRTRASGRCL
jgi:hypothetical protein